MAFARSEAVLVRQRTTGRFIGPGGTLTRDPDQGVRFGSGQDAADFLARHACEQGAFAVVEADWAMS